MYRTILFGMGNVGWCRAFSAGLLRNSSPFDALSYKQKKEITLKNKFLRDFLFFVCDPCRIQTCNPHIRSVVLYSVELTDHCFFSKASAKVLLFFDMTKYFGKKMQNNLILLLFVVLSEQNKRYFLNT